LLVDLVLLGSQSQFAARVQLDKGFRPALPLRTLFHVHVPGGIQIEVKDPRLVFAVQVDPGHGLLHARVDNSLFHQDHTFQKDDAPIALGPGGQFVGVQDDWRGVPRKILLQAKDVRRGGRQAAPNHAPQGQEGAEHLAVDSGPSHGASFSMPSRGTVAPPATRCPISRAQRRRSPCVL
jgi:hypothetical protein